MKINILRIVCLFTFFMACEEHVAVPTGNDSVDFKIKRFHATSIENRLIKQPPIVVNSNAAYLGSFEDDNVIVYSRPFFNLTFSDTLMKYFDVKGDANNVITSIESRFIPDSMSFWAEVRGQNADSNSWNLGFDQTVRINFTSHGFTDDSLSRKDAFWGNYLNKTISQTSDEIVETASGNLKSAEHSNDTIHHPYTFNVSNDVFTSKLETAVRDSIVKGLNIKLFMDYDGFDANRGMTTFDLNKKISDSKSETTFKFRFMYKNAKDSIVADTLNIESVYNWITYQKKDLNSVILKQNDREALIVKFNDSEVKSFLKNNRVYGAGVYLTPSTHSNYTLPNIQMHSIDETDEVNKKIANNRYSDFVQYPFIHQVKKSVGNYVFSSAENAEKVKLYEYPHFVNLYHSIITKWRDATNEEYSKFMFIPSVTSAPGYVVFPQPIGDDAENYVLDVYYQEQ